MRAMWTLVLVIPVLAGCLTGDDAPPVDYGEVDQDLSIAVLPFLSQDHDGDLSLHDDASLHNFSRNIDVVAYHNGVDGSGDPDMIPALSYYTEIALSGDYVFLARGSAVQDLDEEGPDDLHGGFVILDVGDLGATGRIHFVGEYPAMTGADIEVSSDGDLAFFATQRNTIEEVAGGLQQSEQPSSGQGRGIHIVDVSEPDLPRQVHFQPFPYNGPHTVTYHETDGQEYLFVQTYDFLSNTIPSQTGSLGDEALGGLGVFPVTQRVTAYQLQRHADPIGALEGVSLSQVGHFQITDTPPEGKMFFPHDARVQVHPADGRTYLYVAYWDKGVRILDISDLPDVTDMPSPEASFALPEVGAWTQFAPSSRSNIHLAMPFDETIVGRHITVTEPEIISADETGYITFLDTTDPTAPEKACPESYWTLPGDLVVQNLQFSPHNFDTFDGKVALAHNHAGLWILDVHNEENLCAPKSVGVWMDVHQRAETPRHQPYVWGVIERDGLLFVAEESSGLYVLEYTGP